MDLREFIDKTQELKELRIIEDAHWDLEVGAITELHLQPQKPLLLFDKIKGYKPGYRIVSNLAASPNRLALMLGLPLGAYETSLVQLVQAWRKKTKGGLKPVPPLLVDAGPIKENIHVGNDVDLFEFPVPKWHELDGGRYIGTGDMVIMRDPDEGWINCGTYRVQVHDKTTATIFMAPGQHGDIIRRKYWDRGLSCPVAVSCGQDPLLWLVATMRIPWGISEYDYAGWLENEPIEVVKGETTDLPIPATAEIVLEGEIMPPETESLSEGPFGEWSGHYGSGSGVEAAFRVRSILHRNNPILQGVPPFRIIPIGYAGMLIVRAGELWDDLEKVVPGVTGVWFVEEASGYCMTVVSIKQMYPGHAKQAAMVTAGSRQAGFNNKWVIIVDDDIDPSNLSEVLWALGTRFDGGASIDIIKGCWGSRLNPVLDPEKRDRGDFTLEKAIITACKPYHWIKDFPPIIRSSSELVERIKKKWQGVLFQ
jgi:UbiD family decarboxylase